MADVHVVSIVATLAVSGEEKVNYKVGVAPTGEQAPVTHYYLDEITYSELDAALDAALDADGDTLVDF